MGVDLKFSLGSVKDVELAKKFFETSFDHLEVKISIGAVGDRKPFAEAEGRMSKEELLTLLENREQAIRISERKDELTGLLSRVYFDQKVSEIDEAGIVPTAIVNIDINDWRFVNSNYGDEESDRLIQIIARIVISEAKDGYICGRMDGDIFGVIIPNAKDGEAEEFIHDVKEGCLGFDDDVLAPSVAAGVVYKTEKGQSIEDLMSEAESLMFKDKYPTKNTPEYRSRLEKGFIKKV